MTAVIPGTELDVWRESYNRHAYWYEPPIPAASYIVRPQLAEGEDWVFLKFGRGPDEKLCYLSDSVKGWRTVRYRLQDDRWLLCRSSTVADDARSVPKFAVVQDLSEAKPCYQKYDEFDWAALAPANARSIVSSELGEGA